MYGNSDNDLISSLNNMFKVARQRHCFDRSAMHRDMVAAVRNDRRYDRFNPEVLVRQHIDASTHAAVLKLDDPRLRAGGGQARPLAQDTYW
jgi:hypothetical protein